MVIEHEPSISTGRRESTAVASKEPLKQVVETMRSVRQRNVEQGSFRHVSVRQSNSSSSSAYFPARKFLPNKVEPLLENANYNNDNNNNTNSAIDVENNDKNPGNNGNNHNNNNDGSVNNDKNSNSGNNDNNNNDNNNNSGNNENNNDDNNDNMMMMYPIHSNTKEDENTLHSASMSVSMLQPATPHTVLIILPQITVLIVDDSAMNRKVVRRLIEGYLIMEHFKGYEFIIIEADDGTVAIDILLKMNDKKQRIDLVLLGSVCVIKWNLNLFNCAVYNNDCIYVCIYMYIYM